MRINYSVSMERIVPQELELLAPKFLHSFLWEFGFPAFDDVISAITFLFLVSPYPYVAISEEVNMN